MSLNPTAFLVVGCSLMLVAGCGSGPEKQKAAVAKPVATSVAKRPGRAEPKLLAKKAPALPVDRPVTSASTSMPTSNPRPAPKPRATTPPKPNTSHGYAADPRAAIAAAKAQAGGRNVLIEFGASWCGNCRAFEALVKTASIRRKLDPAFVLVQVDIDKYMDVLSEYDRPDGGFSLPVLIVLGRGGKVLTSTRKTGNPPLNDAGLADFLGKWAP